MSRSTTTRVLLMTLYYVLPNLSNFGFISEASHGRIVPLTMAVPATVYAIVYIGILLSAAGLIFRKRNFK